MPPVTVSGKVRPPTLFAAPVESFDSTSAYVEPPPLLVTVQVNVVEPLAPVVSVAVTVTAEVPAVVGVPVTRPLPLMDSPAGRPVAVYERVWPAAESVAAICRPTAVPVAVLGEPGR
ncbi:hypothetical protein GCM10025734_10760 [Kitasatospora paranensis]